MFAGVSGCVAIPLLIGILFMGSALFAPDLRQPPGAWAATLWFVVAFFLACWNTVIGIAAMRDPTPRRLAWLIGSATMILLLGAAALEYGRWAQAPVSVDNVGSPRPDWHRALVLRPDGGSRS